MFIEGTVNKTFLEFMKKAGWKFDWKIEDEEQAKSMKEKGIEAPEGIDFSREAYVRFYVDTDIESYITPEQVANCLEMGDLPMAATCNCSGLQIASINILKDIRKDN